jgi:hypothetical protein
MLVYKSATKSLAINGSPTWRRRRRRRRRHREIDSQHETERLSSFTWLH